MEQARLAAAFAGGLELPEGLCALVEPGPQDLGLIDAHVVSQDAVIHDLCRARGVSCTRDLPEAASVILCLPRSKDLGRSLIAQAVAARPEVLVIDGQKTDGIDSLLKAVRRQVGAVSSVSKAHGRMIWFQPSEVGDAFAPWRDPGPQPRDGGLWTQAGVFSADAPDPGSVALREALPPRMAGHVVDLGAGWGLLAQGVLAHPDVTRVTLVEADGRALDCARRGLEDLRAQFVWADATRWQPEAPVDAVVMNPPFHRGRDGAPDLGMAFITQAAQMLRPDGVLWMVANRHLPYEATLTQCFAQISELPGPAGYRLTRASRPLRRNGLH